jgi:hypothetical protein
MTKEKFYDTAMVALGCFVGMVVIGLLALGYSANKTHQELQEVEKGIFFKKCAAACAPNDVYSTKYNRCTCNAAVIVKEIN